MTESLTRGGAATLLLPWMKTISISVKCQSVFEKIQRKGNFAGGAPEISSKKCRFLLKKYSLLNAFVRKIVI